MMFNPPRLTADRPVPSRWSSRHPILASLVGALVGFGAGQLVLFVLFAVGPLLGPHVRSAGRGAYLVEGLWQMCGIPLTTFVGLIWPHTIGRMFWNERGANLGPSKDNAS